MTIRSPKTEQHDSGVRQIPIFPELKPYLDAVWCEPEPAEYVITRYRDSNVNLRTQLERIIAKAGLKPWPKLFQNLRSTRATELAREFPIHVVTAWLGHSVTVSIKHYLQVTNADLTEQLLRRTGRRSQDRSVTPRSVQKRSLLCEKRERVEESAVRQ